MRAKQITATAKAYLEDSLSRAQAARFFGVSLSTFDRWRRQGKLPRPFVFTPRVVRYRLGDLLLFREQCRAG
jgi:predicted DNA-binding transcriptional regulator AlpA